VMKEESEENKHWHVVKNQCIILLDNRHKWGGTQFDIGDEQY
jgi:hypothetical protein